MTQSTFFRIAAVWPFNAMVYISIEGRHLCFYSFSLATISVFSHFRPTVAVSLSDWRHGVPIGIPDVSFASLSEKLSLTALTITLNKIR